MVASLHSIILYRPTVAAAGNINKPPEEMRSDIECPEGGGAKSLFVFWGGGGLGRLGVLKVSYNLIFFPIPTFFNLDFLPQISIPFPSSPLDILPNSLTNYKEDDIAPPAPFFTFYSFSSQL